MLTAGQGGDLMVPFRLKHKAEKIQQIVEALNEKQADENLLTSYDDNLTLLKSLFQDDDTMQFRSLQNSDHTELHFTIVYCDGIVDSSIIDEHILRPLMSLEHLPAGRQAVDALANQVIRISGAEKTMSIKKIIKGITYGDTLLLVKGAPEALLLSTKRFQTRAVAEPDSEKILSGPREGFTESLVTNLSMIRRRLRTNELKMKYQFMGERSQTQICVAYINCLVNKDILGKLLSRLAQFDIDAVLDAQYINEWIQDNALSPFRTIGYTERPDVVVGKLLEGRVAVFVDGTPVVLTLPYLFIENFQSSEDYYSNFYYASFSRLLRILGFFLTVTVPALYIAIESYHQEMLPAPLMLNIATERQSVPLPAAMEAFLLLLAFDILRETGIRMPSNVGQALSIVGALVVGQAAVEAKFVAAPMIIVVAITGITSLLIPKLNAPAVFVRFGLLVFASIFGFLGVSLGLAILLIHILSLKSFGISQLTGDRHLRYQEVKDTFIRAPWWHMRSRPAQLSVDETRASGNREKAP
jgi:spore germination protein KA